MDRYKALNAFIALAFTLLSTVAPTRSVAQQKNKSAAAKAQGAASSGPREGIKVHGHWSIVIKNPDGSVASRHEFENALTATGATSLVRTLAHANTSVLGWSIILTVTNNPGCCQIAESTLPVLPAMPQTVTNLTVSTSTLNDQLILQGSIQIPAAGSISSVTSGLALGIGAGVGAPQDFSQKMLGQGITVQSNQIVQVSVTFTFS